MVVWFQLCDGVPVPDRDASIEEGTSSSGTRLGNSATILYRIRIEKNPLMRTDGANSPMLSRFLVSA